MNGASNYLQQAEQRDWQLTESQETSDYELAQAVASGETTALGHLYERHHGRVYALCLRMTRNGAEAEDLTQEVFVHLFKKVGSFRGECQFTTWLHRLTVNLVLMNFRRKNTRKENTDVDFDAGMLVSQTSKRVRAVDRIALDAAMARLPAGSRSVFELFDIEGYKHREIANLLGCTIGTSKSQLHKARRKLRRLLKAGKSRAALVRSGLHAIPVRAEAQVR